MPLRLGAPTPDVNGMPALAAVRTLSSTYKSPTNAQAIAALDSFAAVTADQAISDGVPEAVARAFYAPDGILPRMRMLAWGWTKDGDRFKSPSDAAWWKKVYQYPLWAPLETLMDQLQRAGVSPPIVWSAGEAAGDAGELAHSYASLLAEDAPPVFEAPCPRYLIPPGRGQMPIANPECLRKPARDVVDKIPMPGQRPPSDSSAIWLWVLLGLVVWSGTGRRK